MIPNDLPDPLCDETLCVHHPRASLDGYDAFGTAVHRASTIVFPDAASYRQRHARGADGYSYGLSGTPTSRSLELQLAQLNGAPRAIVVASGQAAVSIVMLTLLRAGDHLLLPDNVYSPVKTFAREVLGAFGVQYGVYDPLDLASLREAIRPGQTRLLWIESPGSTSMEVCDLRAIVELARAHGIVTGCDNTWATPLLCKPLQLGVDIVAEALTKYVGGHSDLLLGAVAFRDVALYARVRRQLATLGNGVSPDDCALALRGLETLAVRLERVQRVALDFARRLQGAAGVAQVLHPALPSSPGHAMWVRDFRGSSGVFTLRLACRDAQAIDRALDELRVFAIGASWGGTRSLVAPMSIAGDRELPQDAHADTYLRISVGLEGPSQLWDDLQRMLAALPRQQ